MRLQKGRWMGNFILFVGLLNARFFLLGNSKNINFDLVIITSDGLKPHFEQFKKLKWMTGVPTEIFTTSWIYKNFVGKDRQEKIRNFIRYAHETFSTRYILMGGDVGIIPTRVLYVPISGTPDDFIPSDFYYMCLDGDFNADKDTLYGEFSDSVDFIPEVSVARLPVNYPEDIENYLRKWQEYVFHPSNYLNKAIFVGSDITTPGSGAFYAEEVADSFPPAFRKIEFFETSSNNNSKQGVLDSLSAGAGFIYFNVHAQSFDRMLVNFTPRRAITNFDVDTRLLNSGSPGFYDIVTCHVGGFDVDALAEHLIRDSIGAIAVYSTTRLNYPAFSINFNKFFYGKLFHEGIRKSGLLDKLTRVEYAPYAKLYINYRYVDYGYNLFGDPALKLWTGVPDPLEAQFPDSVRTDTKILHLYVSDSIGAPIPDAHVVIYESGVFFSDGYTNGRGEAEIKIHPDLPGSLSVFVEKDGYRNLLAFIGVERGSHSITLTEKSFNPPEILAGDTASVHFKITNTGSDTLENLYFRASNPNGEIYFIDSTFIVSELLPGETLNINDSLRFLAPINTDDLVKFEVVLKAFLINGDTLITDTVFSYIHRPVIKLEFITDSCASDTVFLNVALKNYGSCNARNVHISLNSGNYTPIIDSATLPDIVADVLRETGYVLSIITDTSFDSVIHLTFEYHGYSFSDSAVISPIDSISSIIVSPYPDGVKISWSEVDNADKYAVYRRSDRDSLILLAVTEDAYFVDSSLTGHYNVAPISHGKFRGPLSHEISGIAHYPIKNGWPVYIEGGTYTSPIIYDFDTTYPGKEIFISSFPYGFIYLYHADGTPVNGWPLFLDGEIWASPSIGDLDDDGEMEIVVLMRSKNLVYAFNTDGSPVNGWPVHTHSGTFYTPAVGDIDGDGTPEVVINDQSSNLYVFRGDGSGFADSSGIFMNIGNWWKAGSPVLFDYDGDGKLDIGTGTLINNSLNLMVVNYLHDTLLVVPLQSRISSPPVIGNFLSDYAGDEILINDNGSLKLFAHSGQLIDGWPHDGFYTAIGADIDYNGELDVVATGPDGVTVFNGHGEIMSESSLNLNDYFLKEPVVGDINDDHRPEVLFESFLGARLYAVDRSGSVINGFPFDLKESPGYTIPVLDDIDGDSLVDIIVGSTFDSLWVLKTQSPFDQSRVLWPTEKFNYSRTGWVNFIPLNKGENIESNPQVNIFSNVVRDYLSVKISRKLGLPVYFNLYDISGRRIDQFLIFHSGTLKLQLKRNLPAGIYFYMIKSGRIHLSGKLLVLR